MMLSRFSFLFFFFALVLLRHWIRYFIHRGKMCTMTMFYYTKNSSRMYIYNVRCVYVAFVQMINEHFWIFHNFFSGMNAMCVAEQAEQ